MADLKLTLSQKFLNIVRCSKGDTI